MRLKERKQWADAFEQIVILNSASGGAVTLGDIATVRDGFEEDGFHSRFNGQPSVEIELFRTGDQSPLNIAAAVENVMAELKAPAGSNRHYDAHLKKLQQGFADRENLEIRARRLAEDVALALQAAVLVQAGNAAVSDAFCVSRLGGDSGLAFGTLPASVDLAGIVERAAPRS